MADVSVPPAVRIAQYIRAWFRPFSGSRAERIWRMVPTVIYMAMIFLSSSVKGPDVPQVVDDRIAHFVVYFGLGLTVAFTVAGFATQGLSMRHLAVALLVAALFGLSDEWHQSFVPGRESSAKDLLFDLLGSGSALALLRIALGVKS